MKRLLTILALLFAFCLPGCGDAYHQRENGGPPTAQQEAARKREAMLVQALDLAEAKRADLETALKLAQQSLALAEAAGMNDKAETAKKVVAGLAEALDKASQAAATASVEVKEAQKRNDELEANGQGPSAGERDAGNIKALLTAVGGAIFGPQGAIGGGLLGMGLMWFQKRKADKLAAEERAKALATEATAHKVIRAIEIVKDDDSMGERGVVHFNEAETARKLSKLMGDDGKALVDSAQSL